MGGDVYMEQKPFTDEEIAEILGTARPYIPAPTPPDLNEVARLRFYAKVRNWLDKPVEIGRIRSDLITSETLPAFIDEAAAFLGAATPEHECWQFSSPQSDWNQLAGRSGYALVLKGTVTHVLVTLMS